MLYSVYSRFFSCLIPLATLLCAPVTYAQTHTGAYEVIEGATDRIMAVVSEAAAYVDEDPEHYYDELQAILDEVVDFAGFARGVMGPFASKSYYQSLDEAGRARLKEQVRSFTEVMRVGLVRTYGKGLLAFGGSRVEVQRPSSADAGSNRAFIVQLIYRGGEEPYVIHYQMRRSRSGDWKLRNLIIESINLGQVYRNQFQAAARDVQGDLDVVIANWSTAEVSE